MLQELTEDTGDVSRIKYPLATTYLFLRVASVDPNFQVTQRGNGVVFTGKSTGVRFEDSVHIDRAIEFLDMMEAVYQNRKTVKGRIITKCTKARIHLWRQDPASALGELLEAMSLANETQDTLGKGSILRAMTSVFVQAEMYEEALECTMQADSISMATALTGKQVSHYLRKLNRPREAIAFLESELEGSDSADSNNFRLMHLVSELAAAYGEANDTAMALKQYNELDKLSKYINPRYSFKRGHADYLKFLGRDAEALQLYSSIAREAHDYGDPFSENRALTSIAELKLAAGDIHAARVDAEIAFQLVQSSTEPSLVIASARVLSEVYEKLGQWKEAWHYGKIHDRLNDSLESEDALKRKAQFKVQYALGQKLMQDSLEFVARERESALANQARVAQVSGRKNLYMAIAVGVVLAAGGLWGRLRYVQRTRATIQKEKERSDGLLLNILPTEVAEELKLHGTSQARDFEQATILFTDFKDFTEMSETLSAQELVAEINTCFKAFDQIIYQHGVEKIKTIGDAYMAAGGVPDPRIGSAQDVLNAAMEMQDFMHGYKAQRAAIGQPAFEMRLGIHTGPVVAGIVGVKKFQYDIWGDAVNTASRMESNGEVGQVNISQTTYDLVKDANDLTFKARGRIKVKGKGEMEMYFVERRSHGLTS